MTEDGRPSGTRTPGKAALVVGAGVLIGLAVEFHWLGWTSFPGNSCGSRYRPCPEGTTPTLVLAFVLTFVGFFGLTAALAAFTPARPGKAVPGALVAAGVLIALWPGWQAYLWMRGPVLDRAWESGPDRPASVRGVGAWAVGEDGTVVRARTDALVAYDSGSGDRGWVLRAPVRESVCAMSERTVDGIGLVAFARDEKPCGTVWGVDVRSGRKVWERNIAGVTAGHFRGGGGLLSADAGVAVALAERSVHGYGLTDGTVRWTVEPVPAAGNGAGDDVVCEPVTAGTAGGVTTVVVTCGDHLDFHSAHLLALDTATGEELSRRELPIESRPSSAAVLSAEPFTLLVQEEDERGLAAVLSYGDPGDPGREPVTIPLTADEEDLALTAAEPDFAARPVFRAVVTGGNLIVAAAKPGADRPERVAAYALEDGRRRWHADLGTAVVALAPAGRDRVAVLGESQRLWTLTAGDGNRVGEEDGTTVRDLAFRLGHGPQLVRAGDGWVIVNADGGTYPPALAVSP
ncbi:PQQ-binding-like beta-propeller repeat protein [Streptomyces prasinosporus]